MNMTNSPHHSYERSEIIMIGLFLVMIAFPATVRSADQSAAQTLVRGIIEQSCSGCHNDEVMEGELNLSQLVWKLDDDEIRERWVLVHDRVAAGEMPPDSAGLSSIDRQQFLGALSQSIHAIEQEQTERWGRGPLRRLTRREYEDNLRDLLHLPQLDIADRLPEDRHAHGFTKVAESLDMSRVQLRGYLDAADAALSSAIASQATRPAEKFHRFTGTDLFPSLETFGEREAMFFARQGKMVSISGADFGRMTPEQRRDPELELALFRSATWPYYGYPRGFRAQRDGAYRVRFSGRAVLQLPGFRLVPASDPLPMSFRARQPSGADVSGDVRETGGWIDLLPQAKVFETTIQLKAGETFEYSLLGLPVPFIRTDGGFFYDFPPMPPEGHRGAAIQWLEVAGPLTPETWPPLSHRLLFGDLPIAPAANGSRLPIDVITTDPHADAERLFRNFAQNAARHPIPAESLAVFINLIQTRLDAGVSFAESLLQGYQAFLCSSHFLYLTEPQQDSYALASRLSHFLWNSRPDEQLLRLADDGTLSQPQVLREQVDRMLAHPHFDRFVSNFTNEWLELRDLRRDIPDVRLYPEYRKDDYLVDSMEQETRAFFKAMVLDNLPATTLVDSDFSFLNDRLAAHYGLPRVAGSAVRSINLPDWSPYGGILTQASILKLTANGTNTSPVLRGVWVMEKLLGQPPPPPPKSVPAIEPDLRGASTIRELLAQHTASDSCAACHARFDPVGFALENFDIMGAWRDRYRGFETGDRVTGIDRAGHPFEYRVGNEVDAAGKLLNGETFHDIHELKRLLVQQPRQLARNLLQQFALYATGTPVRFSDRPEIEMLLDNCAANGYRVGDLLRELVGSRIFAGAVPVNNESPEAE